MNFKIDENLPVEYVNILVDAGHDATSVISQNLQGRPDSQIIDACQAENRSLITKASFSPIFVHIHPRIIRGSLSLDYQCKTSTV